MSRAPLSPPEHCPNPRKSRRSTCEEGVPLLTAPAGVAPTTVGTKTNQPFRGPSQPHRQRSSLLRRRRAFPIFIDSNRETNHFVSFDESPLQFSNMVHPAALAASPPLLSPDSDPSCLVLAATVPDSAAKVTASCAYSTTVRADSASPSPCTSPSAASPAAGSALGGKKSLSAFADLDASPSARRSRARAAMAFPAASTADLDGSARPLRRSMGLFNLEAVSMTSGPTPDSTLSPTASMATPLSAGNANDFMSPANVGIKRPHPFGPRPDAAKPRYTHSSVGVGSLGVRATSAPLRGGVVCSPSGGRGPNALSSLNGVNGPNGPNGAAGLDGASRRSSSSDPFDTFLSRCATSPAKSKPQIPESWYNGAKPLQTAFMSTGLLSKRNARVQSTAPPETPCKKLPANTSLGGTSFRGSRSVGAGLFDPHMSLFSSAGSGGDALTPRNAHSETSILRAGRAPPPVLAGMGVSDQQHTAPSAPTSFLNRTSRKSSVVDMTTPTSSGASSLHHSIRSFSLGSNSPGTPTRVEPAFTSTPAPASRMASDASTVTPSTARVRRHGSLLPAVNSENELSDYNDDMMDEDDDLSGRLAVRLAAKLAEPLDTLDTLDQLDHSMTSSEMGSPHTPDASQHSDDENMHLVGSSSMDSSGEPTGAQARIPHARLGRHNLARQLTINVDRSKAVRDAESMDVFRSSQSVESVADSAYSVADSMADSVTSMTDSMTSMVHSAGSMMHSAGSGVHSAGSIRSFPRNPKTPVDPSFPPLDAGRVPLPMAPNSDLDESLCRRFPKVALLGNGEFSKVYTVGDDSESNVLSVVKRTKRPLVGALHRARRLEEVEILRDLSTPGKTANGIDEGRDYVVHLMDSWEDNGYLYIMTEYCENGSLDSFLAENGRVGRLDEWRVWKIMVEMAHGLRYIHARDFLHLDIKPANIFVSFEGTLKIGDFGMATRFPAATDIEREGDREYIAPEVLSAGLYTKPADVFSLGIMMVEIAANVVLPDNGIHWHKLRSGDLSDAGRLSSGDLANEDSDVAAVAPPAWAPYFMIDQSGTLDKIVSSMLNPDPKLRPSAASFLASPEAQLVDDRRGAGAIVWEGDFGPEPFIESVASRLQ